MDRINNLQTKTTYKLARPTFAPVGQESVKSEISSAPEDRFDKKYSERLSLLQENSEILKKDSVSAAAQKAAEVYFNVAFSLVAGSPGAMLNAIRRTFADGLFYELGKAPEGKEIKQKAESLDIAGKDPYTDSAHHNFRQNEIANKVEQEVKEAAGEPDAAANSTYIITGAMDRAKDYFKIDGDLVFNNITVPIAIPEIPDDTVVKNGYGSEVETVKLEELKWNKVEEYAETRVGPLLEVLKTLGKNDEIRFSNLTFDQSITDMDRGSIELAGTLNLPVSSWSKDINVVLHKNGDRTVVLSDFAGKALMSHYELLTKKALERQEEQPKVKVIESQSAFNEKYGELAGFFKNNTEELRGVDTVVVGYNQAFAENWKDRYVKSVADDKSEWSANIYELPDDKKTRVAILESHASFHGEILGENLRRLVDENPQINKVFTAGSGGSLHIREAYQLVFPSVIGGDEHNVNNILSSGTDKQVHKSVVSPLAETPTWLNGEINAGCTTVDMEMGHVADALAGKDIKLGVGILVTDFPVERSISKGVNLTFQDSSKKYQSMQKYTDAVFDFITGEKPVLDHKLEQKMGKTFGEISSENLKWELNNLGEMTADEKKLYDRFCALEPDYSFRMTSARLSRVLEDGAILSTQQVKDIKGADVKPFTPAIEDKMYGAFDYTFGSVSFHDGDPQYGDMVIKIKPDIWKNRSWATYRSGWRAIASAAKDLKSNEYDYNDAKPELMEKATQKFSTWIVAPKDYMKSMAAYAVRFMRTQDPALLQSYLKADDNQMKKLMSGYDTEIGFLEGKIKGALNPQDIQEVQVPRNCPEETLKKLDAAGIPWTVEE